MYKKIIQKKCKKSVKNVKKSYFLLLDSLIFGNFLIFQKIKVNGC
jgi:hypothetical protein